VERRKEYLQGNKDRNALDAVFPQSVCLPCLPVTLNTMFGSTVTIPKASAATELRKASLQTHRHTNPPSDLHRCSTVEHYTELPLSSTVMLL
jgi:hypothetical protein